MQVDAWGIPMNWLFKDWKLVTINFLDEKLNDHYRDCWQQEACSRVPVVGWSRRRCMIEMLFIGAASYVYNCCVRCCFPTASRCQLRFSPLCASEDWLHGNGRQCAHKPCAQVEFWTIVCGKMIDFATGLWWFFPAKFTILSCHRPPESPDIQLDR